MRHAMVGLLSLALAVSLPAQQASRSRATRADTTASADSTAPRAPERRRLEQRLHERVARVVRDRLDLSAAQAKQLSATSQRYDAARRALFQRERALRLELRRQLRAGDEADEKRVAELLDEAMEIQQRRLDLLRREQSDLATFLTPVQRAKYLALQEQMRERVNELRHRGARSGRRPGPGQVAPSRPH